MERRVSVRPTEPKEVIIAPQLISQSADGESGTTKPEGEGEGEEPSPSAPNKELPITHHHRTPSSSP